MQRRFRKLSDLGVHECARALAIENAALAGKLMSMGLLPGSMVELVRKAPFGHAYYIKADGVRFALREEEAASIFLEA